MSQMCKHGPTNSYILNSPLGQFNLECCSFGLHNLKHISNGFLTNLNHSVELLKQLYPDNGYQYKPVQVCIDWLDGYLKNPCQMTNKKPNICWEIIHSEFQRNILSTLNNKIDFGQTISYSELAELSGYDKKSSRAVGKVMRQNPIILIIPCHRVILLSNKPGHYSGGLKDDMKLWLLKHESLKI